MFMSNDQENNCSVKVVIVHCFLAKLTQLLTNSVQMSLSFTCSAPTLQSQHLLKYAETSRPVSLSLASCVTSVCIKLWLCCRISATSAMLVVLLMNRNILLHPVTSSRIEALTKNILNVVNSVEREKQKLARIKCKYDVTKNKLNVF